MFSFTMLRVAELFKHFQLETKTQTSTVLPTNKHLFRCAAWKQVKLNQKQNKTNILSPNSGRGAAQNKTKQCLPLKTCALPWPLINA